MHCICVHYNQIGLVYSTRSCKKGWCSKTMDKGGGRHSCQSVDLFGSSNSLLTLVDLSMFLWAWEQTWRVLMTPSGGGAFTMALLTIWGMYL